MNTDKRVAPVCLRRKPAHRRVLNCEFSRSFAAEKGVNERIKSGHDDVGGGFIYKVPGSKGFAFGGVWGCFIIVGDTPTPLEPRKRLIPRTPAAPIGELS